MKKRILVVDDDDLMRGATLATLRVFGYEVEESADGVEALERLKTFIPDLIVSDVNMPKLNGFELLQELRKSPQMSDIPFIFLTGQIDRSDQRQGMLLGADDYITKPFTHDELLRAVELRLSKRQELQNKMETRLTELRKSINLALPHEFRTPLTGILGFAEILKGSQDLPQEEAAYIGSHIHKSARRLQQLLENMLLMAELDVDAADPARVKLLRSSSSTVGIALAQRVEAQALQSGRKDDVHLSITDARVKVLEQHLSKAIEELASNALKFSVKGTPVNAGISISGDRVAISIEDKGNGMTQDQIQRLGAFVQFDRARNEQQGSGLGLAIVKKIADLYGGSLSIESSPSTGTKVTLKFPLAD